MLGVWWVEKYVHRMGDAMGVALLHAYTDEELLQQDRLTRILPYVEEAFKYKRLITCKENRRPRVTLLLLGSLKERTRDDILNRRIGKLEEQLTKGK